jgi:hypothetical protein
MWVGYATGAALMATGIILWVLEPDEPGISAGVAPAATGDGLVFSVGGRW